MSDNTKGDLPPQYLSEYTPPNPYQNQPATLAQSQPQPQPQQPYGQQQQYAPPVSPSGQPPAPDHTPQQQQVVQLQVAPETICNNSGNEAMYPISGRLYNQMCAQLGGHNVKPVPDYLTDEKLRKLWLKRGENALLYFMFRKDHYREKLQKNYDSCYCNYTPASKYEAQTATPCGVCCAESCVGMCCCMWLTAPAIRAKLYASEHVSPMTFNHGVCCSFCCGGIELRQVIAQRLSRIGIRGTSESQCYSCCALFCCCTAPCAQTHSTMMTFWLANKRYGAPRSFQDILDEAAGFPQYQEYLRRIKADTNHPYGRAQSVINHMYGRTTTFVNDREWTLQSGHSTNDLGHEYYHPRGAILAHNKYWENYHRIQM